MAEVKVTKKDNFNAILEILEEMERNDLAEVMRHEIELLNRKKSSPTNKNAKVNALLDERILEVLADGVAHTASTIMGLLDVSDIEEIETLSLPRVTNRLTALGKEAKKVDRVQDKKIVTFRLGDGAGFTKPEKE